MKRFLVLILSGVILLTGCGAGGQVMDGDGKINSFKQITQDEAKEMMKKDDGHVIVDVRRQDEYDAGHIPGAILIPNESITDVKPEQLPDLNQIILVYCRTGRRSKEASRKLFDMGYTNVYEFGGIESWDGEIETGASGNANGIWTAKELPVKVGYNRMWIYSAYAESEDPELIAALVDAIKALKVGDPTDLFVTDYTDILTFEFADGSTQKLEFEEKMWVVGKDERYQVEGLSGVRSILEEMMQRQEAENS